MEVRKALASRELIVFETTGVTHRPAMAMDAAQRALDDRLGEDEAKSFVAAIDVRRARSGGVIPLASHDTSRSAATEDFEGSGVVGLALPTAPSFNVLPDLIVEEKPTTAAGRWRGRSMRLWPAMPMRGPTHRWGSCATCPAFGRWTGWWVTRPAG